ncbi:MAG: SDR family NAD(P)-dependent oxidoreductase [Propionibacteriaceae bacterium]|nr:SDR family NAD(P)-dependent oxidoreductase [Propionibacteriaceae bacterium]
MARTVTAPVPDRLPPLRLPDQRGRRIVVTGASSGIGEAAALGLAAAGAQLVLGVRSGARGDAAAERILAAHPGAALSVEVVDLGSLASIADFAARVGTAGVDVLVSNAGLSARDPDARTVDGFDLQVGVNYLGSWALTAGLWPALRARAGARVVTLGSMVARRGRIEDDFGRPSGSTYRSYADSKLAQVVFAGELQRRAAAAGSGFSAVPAHPGWSQTAIFDTAGPPAWVDRIGHLIGALQSPADGAQPILLAATAARPAAYYGPTRRWGAAGPAGPVQLPAGALAPGVGTRLWEITERLTGITFGA